MARQVHFRLIGFALAAILFFGAFGRASSIDITVPVQSAIYDGGTVDLGVVGPGQSLEIVAPNDAHQESSLKAGANADWNQFNILESTLPLGWTGRNGKNYEQNFKAFVEVSPDAADGEYAFKMQAVDEYEGIAPITINAKVRVDRKVFSMTVRPQKASTGVGTPALFMLDLESKTSAPDSYEITVSGFPGAANYSNKRVFMARNSKATIPFEIIPNEQATYAVAFYAKSLSSQKINATATTSVTAKATLLEDMRSAGYGQLLFPHTEQAVIGLLAFLANVLGA